MSSEILLVSTLLFLLYDNAASLKCNYCIHSRKKRDQTDDVNQNPDCMNHLKFGSRIDMRRECASNETYCIATVTNLNGFFIMVERDCATFCKEGCEEHGYGLFYTECTRCCSDSLCNEYDGREYYRQKISSKTPLNVVLLLYLISVLS